MIGPLLTRWLIGSTDPRHPTIPGGSELNRQFKMECLYPWFTGDPSDLSVHSIRIGVRYNAEKLVYSSHAFVGLGVATYAGGFLGDFQRGRALV